MLGNRTIAIFAVKVMTPSMANRATSRTAPASPPNGIGPGTDAAVSLNHLSVAVDDLHRHGLSALCHRGTGLALNDKK